jgi:chorismate mutase-like protein
MDITDWRKKIDEVDRKLVALLSERAKVVHEIGLLKKNNGAPIYEPDRERDVLNNVMGANQGPLPDRGLQRIYERIVDVMRQFEKESVAPQMPIEGERGTTELDNEVND